jgi:ferric-dicitrate binding protein FerR (iron transport regulator)
MKTLAIRLEEEQHAQLGMIAQLEELTVTDAIRQAIEQWIEARRSNPQLQARAEAVLADIDRDAATRREAVASLLGSKAPAKRRGSPGGPKAPQAALGKEEPTNTGYL